MYVHPNGVTVFLRNMPNIETPRLVVKELFMIKKLIPYQALGTLEELLAVSYHVMNAAEVEPKTFCQNNGQIAYACGSGCVLVTPYRPEIHTILRNAGYKEGYIHVPFSNGEECPLEYTWYSKMADEENWYYTYQKALEYSKAKGIQPVEINNQEYLIEEISYKYDEEKNLVYKRMIDEFLIGFSVENLGTYISIDAQSLMICDESGRTYLITTLFGNVDDLIVDLRNAGYKHCTRPSLFVYPYRT